MSTEEEARQLAAWLDGQLAEAPGIDPEVLEAVYALRPERAPAPRVWPEDILAEITAGPFAPVAPPAPANRPLRGWAMAGVGLAAALAIVSILPVIMSQNGDGGRDGEVASPAALSAPSAVSLRASGDKDTGLRPPLPTGAPAAALPTPKSAAGGAVPVARPQATAMPSTATAPTQAPGDGPELDAVAEASRDEVTAVALHEDADDAVFGVVSEEAAPSAEAEGTGGLFSRAGDRMPEKSSKKAENSEDDWWDSQPFARPGASAREVTAAPAPAVSSPAAAQTGAATGSGPLVDLRTAAIPRDYIPLSTSILGAQEAPVAEAKVRAAAELAAQGRFREAAAARAPNIVAPAVFGQSEAAQVIALQIRAGQAREAVALGRRALTLGAENTASRSALLLAIGDAHQALGQSREAQQIWEEARTLNEAR